MLALSSLYILQNFVNIRPITPSALTTCFSFGAASLKLKKIVRHFECSICREGVVSEESGGVEIVLGITVKRFCYLGEMWKRNASQI